MLLIKSSEIDSLTLGWSALWMCWILVKRRTEILRKCCGCIFFSFFFSWIFTGQLTDFHIESICNRAKMGSGFCAKLCSNRSQRQLHRCILRDAQLSVALYLPLTHAFKSTFSGCFGRWVTVKATGLASWPRCRDLITQALCLSLGRALDFVKITDKCYTHGGTRCQIFLLWMSSPTRYDGLDFNWY